MTDKWKWKMELIFTARKRSLGQGNIFIGVCQEFCSQGGCLLLGGVCSGGCLVETPPPNGYCCGPYASYWNAFLLKNKWLRSHVHCDLSEEYAFHFNISTLLQNRYIMGTKFFLKIKNGPVIFHPGQFVILSLAWMDQWPQREHCRGPFG